MNSLGRVDGQGKAFYNLYTATAAETTWMHCTTAASASISQHGSHDCHVQRCRSRDAACSQTSSVRAASADRGSRVEANLDQARTITTRLAFTPHQKHYLDFAIQDCGLYETLSRACSPPP